LKKSLTGKQEAKKQRIIQKGEETLKFRIGFTRWPQESLRGEGGQGGKLYAGSSPGFAEPRPVTAPLQMEKEKTKEKGVAIHGKGNRSRKEL